MSSTVNGGFDKVTSEAHLTPSFSMIQSSLGKKVLTGVTGLGLVVFIGAQAHRHRN